MAVLLINEGASVRTGASSEFSRVISESISFWLASSEPSGVTTAVPSFWPASSEFSGVTTAVPSFWLDSSEFSGVIFSVERRFSSCEFSLVAKAFAGISENTKRSTKTSLKRRPPPPNYSLIFHVFPFPSEYTVKKKHKPYCLCMFLNK